MSRTRLLLVLAAVAPAGFATKLYEGPLAIWVNQSLSGVLYVVFWILVVMFIAPGLQPLTVALSVFLVTAALEVTQLWQPPGLEAIRGHFLGRTLLGTTFVPSDFVYYATGAVMGLGAVQMGRRGSR